MKYSIAETTLRKLQISLILYLDWTEFKKREANANVFQPSWSNWSRPAPQSSPEAWFFKLVSKFGVYCLYSIACAIIRLISSKCMFWFLMHTNFLDFFINGSEGWHNFAQFGINILRWCTDPRNHLIFSVYFVVLDLKSHSFLFLMVLCQFLKKQI